MAICEYSSQLVCRQEWAEGMQYYVDFEKDDASWS